MRKPPVSCVAVVLGAVVAFAATHAMAGALTGPILNEGLTAVLEDFVQMPFSSADPPHARLGILREAPDGSGRLFVNDLNGFLYVLDGAAVETYMDLGALRPNLKTAPDISSGLVSFAFHPEFAVNGFFYTVHTEFVASVPPNLGPAVPTSILQHSVLTEWEASDPSANAFSGTSRELMRIAAIRQLHNSGEIAFRPNAAPGNEDYGLLYIGSGDFGSVVAGQPEQLQRLDTPYGTLMRIDPRGGSFVRGGTTFPYAIPASNPFANDGDPNTLGEIYAYGFRNAHRISWDAGDGDTLLVSDIGQDNIEEVNRATPEANGGWPLREGTFALDVGVDPGQVLPLPPGDAMFGFTYPVAQYDHEEGRAIAGGVVYDADNVSELQGQFVFGDIVNGRIFYARVDELVAADDGDPATTVAISELTLLHQGQVMTLLEVIRDALGRPGIGRTDLRFGKDLAGTIYIMTKQDGFIRKLLPLPRCADGADNDGDGLTDFHADPSGDPGCKDPGWFREDPQCDDEVDNDLDGGIDWDGGSSGGQADSQCSASPWKNCEANRGGDVNCDGRVNVGDALLVALFDTERRECGVTPFDCEEFCDVAPAPTGDGNCDIGDALLMAQCDVGLVPCDFGCPLFGCPAP